MQKIVGEHYLDIERRANFYTICKLRNPIAWVLCYRWLLLLPLTSEERKKLHEIAKSIDDPYDRGLFFHKINRTERFALYNPWLFLVVYFFQVLIDSFSATCKVVSWLWHPSIVMDSGRIPNMTTFEDTTHSRSIDDKFIEKQK